MSTYIHFVTITYNWIHHLHSRHCTREIFVCQPKPQSKPPKKYNHAIGGSTYFTFISFLKFCSILPWSWWPSLPNLSCMPWSLLLLRYSNFQTSHYWQLHDLLLSNNHSPWKHLRVEIFEGKDRKKYCIKRGWQKERKKKKFCVSQEWHQHSSSIGILLFL